MTPFLQSVLETSVPEASAAFDPNSPEDIATFLAFVDADDNTEAFVCDAISFRTLVDRDPDEIDRQLASSPKETWDELIRWGVPWAHESLYDLDARTQRYAAYLSEEEIEGDLATAIQTPELFARNGLADNVDVEWIYKSAALAELLSVWGPNALIDALHRVQGTHSFDILVPFVVANGWFSQSCELDSETLLDIAEDPTTVGPCAKDFAICFALADEESEQLGLVQAAAVLELERRLEEHPAIDGCPGTGSDVAEDELVEFEKDNDGSDEWTVRVAIVGSALSRKGVSAPQALVEPIGSRSIEALAGMMRAIDHPEMTAKSWLGWFRACDPTFGGFCRDAIGLWLLRDI